LRGVILSFFPWVLLDAIESKTKKRLKARGKNNQVKMELRTSEFGAKSSH